MKTTDELPSTPFPKDGSRKPDPMNPSLPKPLTKSTTSEEKHTCPPSSLPHSHGPVLQFGGLHDPIANLKALGVDGELLKVMTEKLNDAEPVYDFYFGSCRGLFYRKDGWLSILAVVNTEKANGHFGQLMDLLERHESVRVMHVYNEELGAHLLKRGYVGMASDPQGNSYEKQIAPSSAR